MKRLLQYLLKRPLLWIANSFSSAPKKSIVFQSLSKLYARSKKENDSKVKVLTADLATAKFIIFSDQHKGDKSTADDFKNNELNYLTALQFYNKNNFYFVNLGDSEELWKFRAEKILPLNKATLSIEAAFQPNRFYKTFGNHDLIWKNKPDVFLQLRNYFTMPLQVYEGIVIKLKTTVDELNIFLTHGHQGDSMSDNNGFSTWLVAHIWLPLQRYLNININTPSKDFSMRNEHNIMMSEWSSSKRNLILVTGHTHCPVFASGKYYQHPSNYIPGKEPMLVKPSYFNTGCCCFDDGDITGIEIADGFIRLIKWSEINETHERKVLEEIGIENLINDLKN
jgi:predicted phosphodiesterase